MGLARLGYSLSILKTFSFAKQFWQLILENRDDRLGKTFPTILAKIKQGLIKIVFTVKNMRCDDAKEKQTKSNLGKTLGCYSDRMGP